MNQQAPALIKDIDIHHLLKLQLCFRNRALTTTRLSNYFAQATDNFLNLALQSCDEVLASGNIINQADRNTSAPDSIIWVTLLVHDFPACTGDKLTDIFKFSVSPLLDGDDLHGDFVLEYSRCVVHRPEDVNGVALGGGDNLLLDILVNRPAECQNRRTQWK